MWLEGGRVINTIHATVQDHWHSLLLCLLFFFTFPHLILFPFFPPIFDFLTGQAFDLACISSDIVVIFFLSFFLLFFPFVS